MSKQSLAKSALPSGVLDMLARLGRNIRTARKRRGMTAEQLAASAFTTRPTLARIEHGDPGVSFAVVAHVLWSLGLDEELGRLADPGKDTLGTALAVQALPKRIRKKKVEKDLYDF